MIVEKLYLHCGASDSNSPIRRRFEKSRRGNWWIVDGTNSGRKRARLWWYRHLVQSSRNPLWRTSAGESDPTTLSYESTTANPSLFARFERGWERRGEKEEREREPATRVNRKLVVPLSLSFPSIRGVADRLTTIHFAARTYARIAITRRKWILARSFRSIPFDAIDLSHHQPPTASLNKPSFFSYPFVRPIINYRSSPSTSSYSEFRSIRGMKRISM